MNKHIGWNNIGAVVIIVLMLLISIGSAITVKFGEDASGDLWAGLQNELITNSNGKAWTATGANLQIAIYDLNSTGGVVYLPNATITITTPINISHSNISLIGSGRNSVLYTADDINILELWGTANFPNDLRGTYIEKIQFLGSAGHTSKAAITMGRAHHNKISECWFDTLYDGMNIGNTDDTDNNWFGFCHFQSITHYAIYMSARTQECSIIGMTMEPGTNCDAGIFMQGENNVISGCCIEEVGLTSGNGYGIYVGGQENTVVGNTIRQCGQFGLYITYNVGVGNHTIVGNSIGDCESLGIYLKGQNHIVSGNSVTCNGAIYDVEIGSVTATDGMGVVFSNNFFKEDILDTLGHVTLISNWINGAYQFLEVNTTATVDANGGFYVEEEGTQILEISSSGTWSYIIGQEGASSEFRIIPGNDYPWIDIMTGEDIRFYGSSGAGDYIRFYESADNYLIFDLNGNDAEISAGAYNFTILDCLKIEPQSDAPTSPVAGMIYYDSDDNKLKCYNGAGWQDLY